MTDDKPWLSLPDEDPPERGLAELMAAARAKAEVMVRPPWWKRVLDLMKRPPVLALATVVVLLGGVIVVGHHRDEVQDARPIVQPESPAMGAGSAAAVEAAPATDAVPAMPQKADEPAQELPPPPPPPPVKAAHHGTAPAKTIKPVSPPKAIKEQPPEPVKAATGAAKLEIADPAADDEAETAQKAPVQQVPVQRGEPLGVQLGRCRAAASKKDCAGARTCAKQLEQRDRAYYDANAANDATLKSCL